MLDLFKLAAINGMALERPGGGKSGWNRLTAAYV
jgi:hypothetical protein